MNKLFLNLEKDSCNISNIITNFLGMKQARKQHTTKKLGPKNLINIQLRPTEENLNFIKHKFCCE